MRFSSQIFKRYDSKKLKSSLQFLWFKDIACAFIFWFFAFGFKVTMNVTEKEDLLSSILKGEVNSTRL
jgi:hypothetical protein